METKQAIEILVQVAQAINALAPKEEVIEE